MDMTLADLCKQLRLNGIYAYVQEYQPNNSDLERFLKSALQAEIDKRHINHQMKSLRQAGFPTKKRFEGHSHRKFRNMEDTFGDCSWNTRM